MNARPISISLAVALLACTPRPAPQPQPSRDADRPPAARQDSVSRIVAAPGDTFFVTLRANATTGYRWRLADSLDARIVAYVGRIYVPDPNPERRVGAGGVERWAFTAVGAGDATITLGYFPPGGGPPSTLRRYAVVVRRE